MNESIILITVFVGVLIAAFLLIDYINSRREATTKLREAQPTYFGKERLDSDQFDKILSTDNEYVRNYFNVLEKYGTDSLQFRLIRAGYFSKYAYRKYMFIRIGITIIAVLSSMYLLREFVAGISNIEIMMISFIFSGVIYVLINAILDRVGSNKQIAYRKLFPEFMDMLIVCVDAGLSIEAAANRISREFMLTNPDFGTHLNIMMLEVRAGRRLRDALSNLADRTKVDEARQLAVLFRQSEELGSSITKALRVYSKEMRDMRMVRAEEKANALPIKMLFPLALCLFPTNLIIVLVPILIRILKMFEGMSPG